MIRAVFDCGVLVSAIGWAGNPRSCLALVHAGQAQLFVSIEIWREYEKRIPEILQAKQRDANVSGALALLMERVRFVEPAPLGKPRSRDLKDEPYLACALAAQADALVSNDRDLLDLGKPFGIAVVTPVQFLKLVRKSTGL
jgi:putative PIN family toxin of toxin-antitoxin system